jgi:hypothetical protein
VVLLAITKQEAIGQRMLVVELMINHPTIRRRYRSLIFNLKMRSIFRIA